MNAKQLAIKEGISEAAAYKRLQRGKKIVELDSIRAEILELRQQYRQLETKIEEIGVQLSNMIGLLGQPEPQCHTITTAGASPATLQLLDAMDTQTEYKEYTIEKDEWGN